MGLEVGTLMAIGTAISAATAVGGAVMSASAQSAAAKRQQQEIYRQQQALRKQEAEQKSDRMRKANAELGTLRAMELGSAASKSRFGIELGYITGVDLGRIGTSFDEQILGLQSQSTVAGQQAGMAWDSALYTSATSIVGAGLGAYTGYASSQALAAEKAASLAAAQHTNSLLTKLAGG